MPIYEYRCTECGFQKEALQKLSDAPLKDCPQCGKPALAKMVTAAGFQLKGSGWYVTDFKNKSAPKPEAKTGDKSGEGAAPSAATTADAAKPDTKVKDTADSSKSETKSDDKAAKPEVKPAAAKPVIPSNS
jgi:putative FmdB family regulatory protein